MEISYGADRKEGVRWNICLIHWMLLGNQYLRGYGMICDKGIFLGEVEICGKYVTERVLIGNMRIPDLDIQLI